MQGQLLKMWRWANFEKYDGSSDLVAHVKVYRTQTNLFFQKSLDTLPIISDHFEGSYSRMVLFIYLGTPLNLLTLSVQGSLLIFQISSPSSLTQLLFKVLFKKILNHYGSI